MDNIFNKASNISLFLNILVPVLLTLVLNGLIFGLGWVKSSSLAIKPPFEPPGWVIGVVWVILIGLIGASRWLINSRIKVEGAYLSRLFTTILIVFILLWPFYSLTVKTPIPGIIGNVLLIALAIFAMTISWPVFKAAAFMVLPVPIWVTFATILIFAQQGWIFNK